MSVATSQCDMLLSSPLMPAGAPMRSTSSMTQRRGRKCVHPRTVMFARPDERSHSPAATATAAETTVARAAPRMPIPNPKMKSGSSPTLSAVESSMTYIAFGASPTPRSAV